ncbi:type II secretion system F family protein [Microbacterium sp. CFBP9034]|uniref:type II secretion system F family protein n=1 Tax=Microbacterium sp. CFBP9034 TaxID=3096540 RepID=UPI002A6A2981|nr:type II secretion system F family protein [Microbacterium sp. CFBP9034]MDY0910761.1 type II secretion system F family protein [Microbacterium sp. CFBP9034]
MGARVRGPKASASDATETVLRLAVLLQAGMSPARAWSHLAASGDTPAARVVASMDDGMPLADAIVQAGAVQPSQRAPGASDETARAWREVAAAWRVATTVGAPLAESLRGLATALRDAQEAADDVRVALAEPAGTARLMGWLPLVAVGLGAALGFDTFAVLLGQPLGLVCLAAGVALIVGAQRWTAALVRRARMEGGIAGLESELLAIALSGGVSVERAIALVRAAGVTADPATEGVLALSRSAGVPAVELLRATSAFARHRARIEGRLRAARLSSRLLLPLGVCTLPAFLFLGVAPMMLSVMSTMPLSL